MYQIDRELQEAKKRRAKITMIVSLIALAGGWYFFEDERCLLVMLGGALLAWIVRSFEVASWEKIQQPGGKGWRSSEPNSHEKER